jgi:hypothetical protein
MPREVNGDAGEYRDPSDPKKSGLQDDIAQGRRSLIKFLHERVGRKYV